MQERFQINKDPKSRRVLGYITRLYRDFISGGDAFFTLVKATITITCIYSLLAPLGGMFSAFSFPAEVLQNLGPALFAAVLPAAPYIITATIMGGLIYLAFGYKDERDRNKVENQKIEDMETAEWREHYVTTEVEQRLGLNHKETIPPLSKLKSGDLLKYLLLRYLQSLGLYSIDASQVRAEADSKRKRNGSLPSQDGMLSLIEAVGGFSRHDKFFTEKLSLLLDRYTAIPVSANFNDRLITAFNLQRSEDKPEAPTTIDPIPKNKGGFRGFVTKLKAMTLVLTRSNTGFGLIIWTSVVLGAIVFGHSISLPILGLSLTVGICSGLSSYVYKKVVEKKYKKNTDAIKAKTDDHKTRYEMLYKLYHLQDKQYKPTGFQSPAYSIRDIEQGQGWGENPEQEQARKAREAIEERAATQVTVHAAYGASIGAVIGISISSVFAIFFGKIFSAVVPMMSITFPGLVTGSIFGFRFGRQMAKAAAKAGAEEIARLNKIIDREKAIKAHIIKDKDPNKCSPNQLEKSLQETLFSRLQKSKQELVRELMDNFTKLIGEHTKPQTTEPSLTTMHRSDVAAILTKKEKVLCTLEAVTGIRRPIRENKLPDNVPPEFYYNLSMYLQEDNNISAKLANDVTINFRRAITGVVKDENKVLASRPPLTRLQKIKNTLFPEGFNSTFQRHIAPTLGALGIGIPLGFMLFGSFSIPPFSIVFSIVMGIYSIHKHLEHKQKAHLDAITEKEAKLNLIGRSGKLSYKIQPPPTPPQEEQSIKFGDRPKNASFIIPGIFSRPHSPDQGIGQDARVARSAYLDLENRGKTSHPEDRFRSEIGPIAAATKVKTFGGHSYFPSTDDLRKLEQRASELKLKRNQSAFLNTAESNDTVPAL